ncbi:pre-mRNA branch site protein p14 [Sporothrix brasiliensis 5110]|uniref:Pre-mRNA branch site protein p14 n=1 Tax=Sporothrix brasiliensis 5110 TaxID=1398154 RepID=A0A0C2ENC1_9PEZI|nr:pre-mRNA branch site protein p14 [Sporothrix brasiliensis 5110]KIH87614.1 pre-mRNA branch site protein p14 [Sporothrix brasiliensis 5110]
MAFLSNRALFVKNLSYNVTPEELFELFGKFGAIRQVRQGIANNTKGTAFVVYEDVMDAKQACDKLNGFNFQNRYLVVLYHQPDKRLQTATNKISLSRPTAGPSPYSPPARPSSSSKTPASPSPTKTPSKLRAKLSPSTPSKSSPARLVTFTPPVTTTSASATTVVSTANVSSSSPRSSGKPSLADQTRNAMPHFVRKLLPTVTECA